MKRSLWRRDEIESWLRGHPQLLEPGVELRDDPLEFGSGRRVDLHGPDPLGRPCLVFFEERFDAAFFHTLMDAAARMGADDQPTLGYEHTGAPRLFVLAPALESRDLQRLEFLGKAASLRAFSIGLSREGERLVPVLSQEFPHQAGEVRPDEGLPPERARILRRVLDAARVIRPPMQVRGSDWPLVLLGRRGPCAALHRDGDRVLLVAEGRIFELDDDQAGDQAVDWMLRCQWQARAQPETA